VARPLWFRFIEPGEHPVLDRLMELFATNQTHAEDRGVARLLHQLANPAPAPSLRADTPAQIEPAAPAPTPSTLRTPAPWVLVPAADPVFLPADSGEGAPLAVAQIGTPEPEPTAAEPDARTAIALIGGTFDSPVAGTGMSLLAGLDTGSRFVVLYNDMLDAGLVVDRSTKTLLTGGVGDWPELGQGDDDTLILSGDFSSGSGLPSAPDDIDTLVVLPGFDYNLTAADRDVGAGETLTINAAPLLDANRIQFDGSAETDGRFLFYGGDMADTFLGGAGNDRILGGGGGDQLAGGGGRDEFVYVAAGDSTGAAYDTIGDFNAAADRIDLAGTVTGFAAAVTAGTLSQGSFAADLAAAAGGLGASQAMWFAPDAGDLAGNIFLVVDANGIAGYQDGEDLVIAIGGSPLADLSGHTDIFI
jgi:Ca2+-binding RTX toxin-like protein